ncbi:MAG: SPASM domain-containing protein [Victivallaceae bacterium]|nr:SPASM domain-containing protein [Victivallaceae bacterium]
MKNKFSTQSVALHLTHNCNLRCSYCYAGRKMAQSMDRATIDQIVAFSLNEAERRQVSQLDVIFFGGEPLLELELLCYACDKFITQASDINISFSLSTNGLLLTPETLETLSQKRIYISVSIDGIPDVQDKQRPLPTGAGSSAFLLDVIPHLLKWNPCADVRCVVTPHSAAQLDKSVQWLAAQGFAYITTALDYSAGWTKSDLFVLKEALERLADWYCRKMQAGESLYLSCFDERISTRTKEPLQCSERCAIGIRQYSIAPSGNLYPCVQFVQDDTSDKLTIGDIWQGFDETKRNAIYNCAAKDKKECKGCKVKERCSSWCACANWSSTGKIDAASPVVCEYERIIIPIADTIGNRLWKNRSKTFVHKFYNPAFPVLNFAEQLIIKEADNVTAEQ